MTEQKPQVQNDMELIVDEWIDSGYLKAGDIFVIGCSTSEVAGEHIGTSGSEQIAADIYHALLRLKSETGVQLAFQCCEHINRALLIEEKTRQQENLREVLVIPTREAGGAMPAYAYKQMDNPVMVEHIQADAGIDIGTTLIGMHLKHVAVPLRFKQKDIGYAKATVARTRLKRIGGERASYTFKS